MRAKTTLGALAGAGAIALLAAAPAVASGGANLTVGCGSTSYPTIQAAVNAAPPNSRITICPGTYYEQVNIPAGKGQLVLAGNHAVIQFPTSGESASGPNGADAVVAISTAAGDAYQLSNLVIQGPWTDGPNGRHFGIYVIGSGSAQINNDTITNIEDSVAANQSAYDGFGVAIGDSGLFDDGAEVPGNATVNNSTISNYQQFGLSVSVSGSTGTVNNNSITGLAGGIPGTPLVGVVVGDGASASVHNNTISHNVNPTADPSNDLTQGNGIFVGFAPAAVSLHNNNLTRNDIGLEIDGASGVNDHNESVTSNTFDGIHIDAQDPFDDPSSNNTITNDHFSGNGTHDCEDDTSGSATAGTADTWTGDHGATATPAGICTR